MGDDDVQLQLKSLGLDYSLARDPQTRVVTLVSCLKPPGLYFIGTGYYDRRLRFQLCGDASLDKVTFECLDDFAAQPNEEVILP